MIRKGQYFVPSMNNYESKDDVLILITDFSFGKILGINIRNQDDFEFDEDFEPEDFEYYYEPATNGDVIKAIFSNASFHYHKASDIVDDYVSVCINDCDTQQDYSMAWWNAPYQKGGKE